MPTNEQPPSLADIADFTQFTNSIVFPPAEDGGASPSEQPTILSIVATPMLDSGIVVSGVGTDTLTVSGQYNDIFPRPFTIMETENAPLTERSYTNLPASFTAITEMRPHSAPSTRTVIYTVTLNTGVVEVPQTVTTDWSRGRAQLLEALSRTIW